MIIELGETLISDEIFEKNFACDLQACKGACCVEGDRGAPLLQNEIDEIGFQIRTILEFMSPESRALYEKEGFHEGSEIDDPATQCLPGGECIFAIRKNGILLCSIEEAYNAGQTTVNKPISCHLYPIRISHNGTMEMLNYHKWSICDPACSMGNKLQLPLFRFLKNALTRKYGESWYQELEKVYEEYNRSFGKNDIGS